MFFLWFGFNHKRSLCIRFTSRDVNSKKSDLAKPSGSAAVLAIGGVLSNQLSSAAGFFKRHENGMVVAGEGGPGRAE